MRLFGVPGGTLDRARASYGFLPPFDLHLAARPVVTGLSPGTGPDTGSTVVTVSGSGFTGAFAVYFGTTLAAFVVVSDVVLVATSPAEAAGAVDVTVAAPGGTSAATGADLFTFVATVARPPLSFQAAQHYGAGAVQGQVYAAGAEAGQLYVAGAVAGMVSTE